MTVPRPLVLALWVICALAIALLVVWCLALPDRTPPVFAEGDPAVIELYTWQAAHGLWEYGPYSRFGWHHPGPLYFYLLAPFYIASGHHALALDAGALAINLAALTVIAWGLTRYLERRVALLLLVSLSWYVFQIGRLLTSTWNPHVLLMPLFATLIAAAIVMAGRLSWLPLLVGLGSFVAQTHVGLLPCVAVVCATATVRGLLRAGRDWRWKMKWTAASLAVIALLWWPTLLAWRNIADMLHFFGPSGPWEAGISLHDALAAWSSTLTAPARFNATVPYGNIVTMEQVPLFTALAAIEVILLALAAWRWNSKQRNSKLPDSKPPQQPDVEQSNLKQGAAESSLAVLCAVASVMALVSISRIRGGLADHLVGWVTTLGALNVGVLIGAALTWIDERRLSPLVPIGGIALVLGVACYGGWRIEWERQELIRKAANGRTPAQALYQELRSTMGKARIRKPLIHGAVLSWPQAAGIALQFTKKEQPFASDLVWLLGPQVTPRGDEDADITVADTPTRHTLASRPGDCMLIERHGTSIHLLALPPERFPTLTCVAP